ncbi:hypothetical protein [Lichenibacterium ramalinae]|uniref:Uncharacterized protein n=1 Tax=Lichenibacterium ramalinae TaxID=2316527 RepID=A0A4Q2R604_9HYPH|nr:hypothetical protein [Lichenibacterium ramalinae]RYB01782.1 hypothetical protein D3272_24110 [Lichenibacterium ramalinae]
MFVDFQDQWRPGPWEPKRPPGRLTKRQERVIGWLVGINLLLLLVAPLGGSTLVAAFIALLGG